MNFDDLLPRPREISRRGGTCRFDAATLHVGHADLAPPHAEAYVIDITPAGVNIAGRDAEGEFYARQTLDLLLQDGSELPCGTIRDWPAMRRRGIHVDLKGYQPKFPRLLELVRMLARYKVNTILLELEDKFAFTHSPDIGIPGAYTAQQMSELSRLCSDLHIQLIPKLQCLGHVDYILKHARYKHLRENDHPFQFCPAQSGTWDLWQSMANELFNAFPGHTYFHVGGDETAHLGECAACAKVGKARTYINHVGRCVDFVTAAGRTPILWDDILRNLHGHLSEAELGDTWQLGERAVLMYWAYGYHGKDNVFPFLQRYRERGLRVWGASGYSGSGESWFQNVPSLRHRAMNIDAWTTSAVEHQLEGVMCTQWTRIISFYPPDEIPEACWYNALYAAESMWSGRPRDLVGHCGMVSRSLFGADLPDHAAFLLDLDHRKLPAELKRDVRRNADRFELLTAAMAMTDHEHQRQHGWLNIYEILHAHHGLLGHAATDYALKLFRERLDRFRSSLATREAAMRTALEHFYEPATVQEVVRSRFARDHDLVAEVQRLIDATQPI